MLDNGDDADGIEFSLGGSLYIASNFGNKIIIVAPDGTLDSTVTNDDLSGEGEFDFPASLLFNDAAGTLLVLNYAYASTASHYDVAGYATVCVPDPTLTAPGCAAHHHYVIEVYVGDSGWPEARPVVP